MTHKLFLAITLVVFCCQQAMCAASSNIVEYRDASAGGSGFDGELGPVLNLAAEALSAAAYPVSYSTETKLRKRATTSVDVYGLVWKSRFLTCADAGAEIYDICHNCYHFSNNYKQSHGMFSLTSSKYLALEDTVDTTDSLVKEQLRQLLGQALRQVLRQVLQLPRQHLQRVVQQPRQ